MTSDALSLFIDPGDAQWRALMVDSLHAFKNLM